jgi:hypothetical protein
VVGQPDHLRTGRAGLPHQPPHRHPPPDPTRAWSAQVHRPQRSQQPQARQDHRPLAGSHGTSGREEGRPDPRRRRVAHPRPQQRPEAGSRPRQNRRRQGRLPLPALHRGRILPTGLHRTTRRREGHDRSRIPRPSQGLVRRPRHHPHPPHRHRQRRLLPLQRLRPHRRPSHPPPEDQALHATPQRQGRALPEDHDRGTPLRPRIRQRGRTLTSHRHLERPLQLPSTPQRRGRPTASIPTQDPRHQRPALIHLDLRRGGVPDIRADGLPGTRAAGHHCGRWWDAPSARAASLASSSPAAHWRGPLATHHPQLDPVEGSHAGRLGPPNAPLRLT